MKRKTLFGFFMVLALLWAGCINPAGENPNGSDFVPVDNITGVPAAAYVGSPLPLSGTVSPTDATNQTIAWTVKNAGTTGASINGNTLTVIDEGTVVVTATIANGTAQGTAFTQDFTITISDNTSFVSVASIGGIPTTASTLVPLTLNGIVSPPDATNQTIVWSINDAGTTGATINGNTLTVTAEGTVVVTAAIANGTAQGTAFTRDFTINVLATRPSINLSLENFTFTDTGEGDLTDETSIALSKAGNPTQTINAIDLSGVYWYLGNIQLGTGNSITLNAGNFNVGTYTLSITFSKDGKSWIGRIPFAVTE